MAILSEGDAGSVVCLGHSVLLHAQLKRAMIRIGLWRLVKILSLSQFTTEKVEFGYPSWSRRFREADQTAAFVLGSRASVEVVEHARESCCLV